MLADDFRSDIALDALGTGIPVGDTAIGVEHVDRIVAHALHNQRKLSLVLRSTSFARSGQRSR